MGHKCFKSAASAAVATIAFISLQGCTANRYSVYQFDNGDDYICEYIRRIENKNGKIGFADEKGNIIISPRYAFATRFENGMSKATFNGYTEKDGVYYSTDGSPIKQTIITRLSDGFKFLSDDDGNFNICVENGDTLNFDYVGTIKRNIAVSSNDSTHWNVCLEQYIPGQDEEVISLRTGYYLKKKLEDFVKEKDARIGIAVIIDGRDTVSVNGNRDFPMLSVYKFPQAIAVADYCARIGISVSDTISVEASEIKENTWSPMRDRYGVTDLRIPLGELLEYSLQQSDNNACDVLFRMIGGPGAADSLMKSKGFEEIHIASTEDDMHRDIYLCYENRATPMEMARLFDRFYRLDMRRDNPVSEAIGNMMITCNTGMNRIASALKDQNARLGHKTGTGDINSQGRIIAVNDAGYVFLPDGHGYAISVFIADSAYDMEKTEKLIAGISKIVYDAVCP